MKKAMLVMAVLGCCAGLAAWQQRGMNRTLADIRRLSQQLAETRKAVDEGLAEIVKTRKAIRSVKAAGDSLQEARSQQESQPLPGPDQEGRWPAEKPYFYLDKRLLRSVRLREQNLQNTLFEGRQLNRHMTDLLGMTEAESAAVEEAYGNLRQQVRVIESAAIQRLEPPEVDAQGQVLARLPGLKVQVEPVLDQFLAELRETLGPSRAEVLAHHVRNFLNHYYDALGLVAREFLLQEGTLTVRYTDPVTNRRSVKYRSYSLPSIQAEADWEYAHLFGSGAPCELK